MKKLRLALSVALAAVLVACGSKGPDVSHIQVALDVQRFEKDFFAIDTNQVNASLQQLQGKYPHFLQDFVFNVLALPAHPDSMPAVMAGVKEFLRTYQPVYRQARTVFAQFEPYQQEIHKGLQHVKYYFPDYQLPTSIVTFVGPLNSYGNILTPHAIAVGLQLYLGAHYPLYQSELGQQLYPLYVSRRFEPAYVAVSAIKNIVADMYPDNSAGRPLVEQMIEAGKRLYVLDKLMPGTPDSLKTGYTQHQLEGSYKNEAFIWSFFVQNDLLFTADPSITKDYMTEAPTTAALGQASPGMIGHFVGWQIVKKWMSEHDGETLLTLMATDAKTIYEQAKYKPR